MRQPTPFASSVYEALKKIPRGRVTTYGILAAYLGTPRGARAVGNALNRNPHAPQVPCHRVVSHDGSIGGYAFGSLQKIKLLTQEGVMVQKGKIDLEKFCYRFIEKK